MISSQTNMKRCPIITHEIRLNNNFIPRSRLELINIKKKSFVPDSIRLWHLSKAQARGAQ